jgi:Ca2+-binding RTX toxin-like protein
MRTRVRFVTIVLASTVLVGVFLAAAAGSVSAATPKCFGKKATIVGTDKADLLKGTNKVDVIVGLGGNDTIKGLGGKDRICGGPGNDKLYGGPSFDLLWGDVGNDQLVGQGGYDDLWGNAGNDTLNGLGKGAGWAWYTDAPNAVNADLSTGQATGDGTDKLIGIVGLVGSDFNDTLIGDENANFFEGHEGDDTIDGGGNTDLVAYFTATGPVTIDLTAGTATGQGTDTLTGVEDVYGGPFDDTIAGDANPNYIHGGAGNDTISALDGDDNVYGGDGHDTIDAGNGTDKVDGGSGTDSCLNGEDVSNCES